MNNSLIFIFLLVVVIVLVVLASRSQNGEITFDQNYQVTWGGKHFVSLNQGKEIQLTMDNSSGSGFRSKMSYGSGFFHMRIKVPGGDSAGVVTAYYLTSKGNGHDELDFEFLGNRKGMPYLLQTNVFANGVGNREQRLQLWFDPTADFHDYAILWNKHQIVFYVDNVPIRVYKNKSNIGAGYPSKPMQIEVSLWNGERWATAGGKGKINWIDAPFKANFKGFGVNGCEVQSSSNDHNCASDIYWWNAQKYWQLNSSQQIKYDKFVKQHVTYDYCKDRERYPKPPLECK